MVDYSKWKDIEVSDDEDDTHPNIDTPSLFRWRHEARVQRTKELQDEKDKLLSEKSEFQKKVEKAKERVNQAEQEGSSNLNSLKQSLEEIVKQKENMSKQWSDFEKKEKNMPWNVDTISSDGFSKTVINDKPRLNEERLSEEERERRMRDHIAKYEKDMKRYGMLQKFEDSRRFLTDNMHLVCEETANYLVIWAINLEMEEKHSLMEHVAHQCICMNYIMELGKQLNVHPKACVSSFFKKIQVTDDDYKKAFHDEVESFKGRIRRRAAEKVEVAMKEYEEEERQKRLGPGGLDPAEVYESLPEALQKCFDSQDVALLQQTIAEMDQDEARFHMKRCVDSGLWVADAKAADAAVAEEQQQAEPVYEEAGAAAAAAADDDDKPH